MDVDAQTRPETESDRTSAGATGVAASRGGHRTLKKTPYPGLVGKSLYAAARVRVAMWDRSLSRVEEVQTRTLRDFVKHAKDTTFGRRYGFADIRTYEQYAARVPVGDYDSFSTAFEAMRAGETGILVPPRDLPAIGGALARLVGDAALRRRLGDAGCARAQAHFGAGHMLDRMEAVFRSAIGSAS